MQQDPEGTHYYRLDENLKPVRCATHGEWIIWRCNVPSPTLVVGRDTVNGHRVSTSFIPIGIAGDFPQHFYETAVFDPSGHVISRETTATRAEAVEQHDITTAQFGRP